MTTDCKLNTNYNSKVAYNATVHECRVELEEEIDEIISEGLPKNVGIYLTSNNESMPVFAPVGSCERIIARKTSRSGDFSGARIVLTRDNFGHRATGLGGAGATKCEAIDIVAGSLSCAKTLKDGNTQSRANFAEDGARLYLTERGDVNAYFATAKSETAGVYASSKFKSGIGLKSDHTLIIGRERVRILAGLSNYSDGERLVTGNDDGEKGISIVEIGSTSSEKHHRAVLGENLVKYLKLVNKKITLMNSKIADLQLQLVEYKQVMALHTHQGVGTGFVQTFPDFITAGPAFVASVPEAMNGITKTIVNEYNSVIEEMKAFGLENIGVNGDKDNKILSRTVYIGE